MGELGKIYYPTLGVVVVEGVQDLLPHTGGGGKEDKNYHHFPKATNVRSNDVKRKIGSN